MYVQFCNLHIPFTQIGGAPVAFATRKDIAISSQFLADLIHVKNTAQNWMQKREKTTK